jgi:hypothetical protein
MVVRGNIKKVLKNINKLYGFFFQVTKNCSVELGWFSLCVCNTKDVKIIVLNGYEWKENLQPLSNVSREINMKLLNKKCSYKILKMTVHPVSPRFCSHGIGPI